MRGGRVVEIEGKVMGRILNQITASWGRRL